MVCHKEKRQTLEFKEAFKLKTDFLPLVFLGLFITNDIVFTQD